MAGYYEQPEATKAAFTEDGFLRTGDLCRIDHDGYVYITGRVKDNFKTAKGKYVAPVPIERELARDPHVELVCVVGSGSPQPAALVQLAQSAAALPRDRVRASLKSTLDAINPQLEAHAALGGILVVEQAWTTDNDVLTPTLKIKRHVLEQRFGSRVAALRGSQVRWEDEA